jgi:phosphoribosylanthranilate isomerase
MRNSSPGERQRAQIKICGITSAGDARMAVELGADLIGLNLVAGPRKITLSLAMEIATDPHVRGKAVLLVRDWPGEWDAAAPEAGILAGVQYYGPLDHPCVMRFVGLSLPLFLPVRVADAQSLAKVAEHAPLVAGAKVTWLLDSHAPGKLGGTGQVFDWSLAKEFARRFAGNGEMRWGLAGGLTPHNVADAIQELAPDLVDVSSGVEEPGRPGVKNRDLVRDFVAATRKA